MTVPKLVSRRRLWPIRTNTWLTPSAVWLLRGRQAAEKTASPCGKWRPNGPIWRARSIATNARGRRQNRPPRLPGVSIFLLVLVPHHGNQPFIGIDDRLHGSLSFGTKKLGLTAAFLNVALPTLNLNFAVVAHCIGDSLWLECTARETYSARQNGPAAPTAWCATPCPEDGKPAAARQAGAVPLCLVLDKGHDIRPEDDRELRDAFIRAVGTRST
jgi:hypothetical protein